MTKVIIDDVAAEAGVSIKTVSRVMNREPNVRPATRQKVEEAAKRLGYRPNASARGLAGNRSYLIALLYDSPSAAYLTNLQSGVLAATQAENYGMVLQPCQYDDPHLADKILTTIRDARLDGVVLTPPLSDHRGLIDSLVDAGIPHVIVSPPATYMETSGGLCVYVDDKAAAQEMTAYILGTGLTRIAFIKGTPTHGAALQRFDGYKDALKAAGLDLDPELVKQGYFDFESGVKAAEELLALPQPPSAIFASNDEMAAGVLHVAHERGLKVPDDVSVVGFDDTPLSRQIWPALTTVRQPIRQMGGCAARMLISRIRQSGDAASTALPYELVIRHSTGGPK
ncbi:LacI family DNA-binding transcriptional regulator [Kordiimonas sediminis]|uniref:LacI family DNA-binding transcriptional regulator n=1 Tax=Kordiimonas sediminis TaxID=1735581 RepID=UPI00174CB94C|nr:LacI family DNA-binding transcriptional regulator [Kordiimonas sediminis]